MSVLSMVKTFDCPILSRVESHLGNHFSSCPSFSQEVDFTSFLEPGTPSPLKPLDLGACRLQLGEKKIVSNNVLSRVISRPESQWPFGIISANFFWHCSANAFNSIVKPSSIRWSNLCQNECPLWVRCNEKFRIALPMAIL
jgi:hypothetical protein